jgi:AraC-like DNA-binding protein
MSQIVPLIRAAALAPMVRWMQANGRPVRPRLEDADLGYLLHLDPNRPVPLLNGLAFLRDLGRREGPDIGCRMVAATSVLELAMLGKVALGAPRPREALQRLSAALPHHCTHEHVTATAVPVGVLVRDAWSLPLDDEVAHLIQQYVAAVVKALCGMTGARRQLLARVEIVPHPEAGLEHLRPWFGAALVPARSRSLAVTIDAAVVDRPFVVVGRDRIAGIDLADWPVLRGDGSLSGSVREVVSAMLEDGKPTVERLAVASGLSVRTLQRRLSDEGTSFSQILDSVRRDAALSALADPGNTLADLAVTLAYAQQSALTRSVRRWTGLAPSLMRRQPVPEDENRR